ncbi:hypothetical protein WR25_08754 [Diploscapter pachys]|uniref:Uncharacterized protein n=1 Tax=Diploscapter pachys TaxID=2018661 RepID=A0A2A2KJZ5_9BILA|nr:hypothetical protein WR25_08754 [Diploscapter pachys]
MWGGSSNSANSSRSGLHEGSSKTCSVDDIAEKSKRSSKSQNSDFLNRNDFVPDKEQQSFIKLRYKDTAKFVIWPACRLPDGFTPATCGPPPLLVSPTDPRAVLMKPNIEDDRSPYLPPMINSVLRSDSEDSESAEGIMEITRL